RVVVIDGNRRRIHTINSKQRRREHHSRGDCKTMKPVERQGKHGSLPFVEIEIDLGKESNKEKEILRERTRWRRLTISNLKTQLGKTARSLVAGERSVHQTFSYDCLQVLLSVTTADRLLIHQWSQNRVLCGAQLRSRFVKNSWAMDPEDFARHDHS